MTQVKASSLPNFILPALVISLMTAASVPAQDVVTLQSGPPREGRIVGVKDGNIRIETQTPGGGGKAEVGLPLSTVKEIKMNAPAEFTTASDLLAKGDAKGALAVLEKLNQTFAGLPADWAQRAAAMLGDAKLAAGDKAGAKAAYDQFSKTYPQAVELADLGLARLAVDEGKYQDAETRLTKLLATSAKTVLPPQAQGALLTQSHYLMGRVREAAGDNQSALQHYLMASATFPFDRTAAAEAQTRADELRAKNPGLIAP